ncbi:HlyD family efflux transporter periplasmic adaptor subunit [Streptomyces sp. NPDC053755]|uniref:HlyD family efflux transporter periplasmic adaptor subunit n=1 Tax=Streptomyces sp. NPDC053755 TaxID=3155815 RepID=UPI00342B43C6
MQFRQQALSKLQSADEIDLPVRFARPQGRLVLCVTVIVMIAASLWAVTGTVATTLDAPGILTHGQGSYVLQSPVAGQVTDVLAEEGARVAADVPLLRVRTPQGTSVAVRSLAAGRLTALATGIGSVVTVGSDVAAVERVARPDDPLMAVVYVPADSGSAVPVGAAVDLTVQSVAPGQYGVLRGRVTSVGRTAQSAQQIAAFLGSARLGERLAEHGQGLAVPVRIRLVDAPGTASGHAWSSAEGPPFRLSSMTPADGAVHLAEQHPIDWLLP